MATCTYLNVIWSCNTPAPVWPSSFPVKQIREYWLPYWSWFLLQCKQYYVSCTWVVLQLCRCYVCRSCISGHTDSSWVILYFCIWRSVTHEYSSQMFLRRCIGMNMIFLLLLPLLLLISQLKSAQINSWFGLIRCCQNARSLTWLQTCVSRCLKRLYCRWFQVIIKLHSLYAIGFFILLV